MPTWDKATDKNGKVVHHFHYGKQGLPAPVTIQCQCSLTDASGQVWSGSDSLLVHPASEYVGMMIPSDTRLVQGKTFSVSFCASSEYVEMVCGRLCMWWILACILKRGEAEGEKVDR